MSKNPGRFQPKGPERLSVNFTIPMTETDVRRLGVIAKADDKQPRVWARETILAVLTARWRDG